MGSCSLLFNDGWKIYGIDVRAKFWHKSFDRCLEVSVVCILFFFLSCVSFMFNVSCEETDDELAGLDVMMTYLSPSFEARSNFITRA